MPKTERIVPAETWASRFTATEGRAPTEAEKRDALEAECWKWLGTPYRDFGRSLGKAADCIFPEEVGREVIGYPLRHSSYSKLPKDRHLEQIADKDLEIVAAAKTGPITDADLRHGDLALFYGRNPNEPQHFGMIARHRDRSLAHVRVLIHAAGGPVGGRVVAQSFSNRPEWLAALCKIYRFPGVVD